MATYQGTLPPSEQAWWKPDRPLEPNAAPAEEQAQDSPVAYAALVAFTFVLLLAPQSFLPALKPLRLALVTALIAISFQLLHRFLRGQPLARLTREMFLGAALAGWAVATVPVSYWPGGSVELLLDLYFKAFAVFWLLANVATTPDRLRWLCCALTLMAVPLALTAIRNFLAGEYAWEGVHTRIMGYDAGLTQNPNDLALMLNLLLPLSAALLGSARSRAARAAVLVALVLDAAAIVFTFSRTGFLTLAASSAFILVGLARRGHWRAALAVSALAAASLPFLPDGYRDRLATIVDIESDPTGSAQARWNDTVTAARFVLDHPILGAGVGMNVLALNDVRGARWTAVHNVYLEYGVDMGLPGLALFLLLFLSAFRTARTVWRKCGGTPELRELRDMAYGIQVSLAAFAVAACFHPAGYHFYFFYMAGLAVAARGAFEMRAARGLFEP